MNLQFFTSKSGNPIVAYAGYSYRFDYDLKSLDGKSGCCVAYEQHKCKGRIRTSNNNKASIILGHPTEHNHAPEPGKVVARHIAQVVATRASQTVEATRQIIQKSRAGIPLDTAIFLPSYRSSQRTIQRKRKQENAPWPNPNHLSEINVPENLRFTTRNESFLIYDSGSNDANRITLFSTTANINLMASCENWFMDGTFSVAPRLFYQVYTIHALKSNKVLPLVYALMTNKTQLNYTRMFEELLRQQPNLNPQTIMMDFEKGAMNAVSTEFCNATVKGRFFI